MNSRQYEAMRIAEDEAKKNKATTMSHNKLIRHLKRKSENELVDSYLNNWYNDVKEVKAMVRDHGWTWKEAKECKHRNLNYFLDPSVNFWLDRVDRDRYRRMFKKDIAFLFVRGQFQKVYWYPTLDDVLDFIEESAILFKDPDHMGLAGIDFTKDEFEEDGKIVEFYMVTFSLDS
jgi:hypothetical protein